MNRYQKKVLELSEIKIDVNDANLIFKDNELVIEQSENAHIVKYNISITNPSITSIRIDDLEIKSKNNIFSFTLDFNKKAKTISFEFSDGIVDSITLDINYNEKSKEAWDEKQKSNRWSQLIPEAKITFATGSGLVNIYFQRSTDDYKKTVIELYTAKGEWSTGVGTHGVIFKGHVPQLLSASAENLIAKYTVEEEMYFKSITGLANGAYGFKLSQYNKNDELLFTSDYIYFGIRSK